MKRLSQAPLLHNHLMPDIPALPPTTDNFDQLMQAGASMHTEGRREEALAAFEQALAQRPQDLNAATACASVLTELQRPQAAWAIMVARREVLLADADGACNLAVMAEACDLPEEARAAYDRALELDPAHVRALNNRGLMARTGQDWSTAVNCLQRAVDAMPQEPALRVNLIDVLCDMGQLTQALDGVETAIAQFGPLPDLCLRRASTLAFMGSFELAGQAIESLDPDSKALFARNLAPRGGNSRMQQHPPPPKLDAWELFAAHAFNAMQRCDWRFEARVTSVVHDLLTQATSSAIPALRDWRDLQFHSMMLPITEDTQSRIWSLLGDSIRRFHVSRIPPFHAPVKVSTSGNRFRIGIATASLDEPRYRNALVQHLAHHDRKKFALFLYVPTPMPQELETSLLRPFVENVTQIAHMTDIEAAQRMRVDQLDLWIDDSVYTANCRPEPPALRVAPLHARFQTWQRRHSSALCEYSFGDTHTHPDMTDHEYGAVVRLPHTCWLACNNDMPTEKPSRESVGLSAQALVLACFNASVMLDPQTFALWMQALRGLPHAVLWLPAYNRVTQANLRQQAELANVAGNRLYFLTRTTRLDMLAQMPLADLFLDTLRFNANHGLADALRMGVPAVSCAGHNMASRLGGSIIRAAGLADCVVDSEAAYLDRVLHLGRNTAELAALRQRLATAHSTAPLFDTAARVREWESAWVTMIERQRAGLPPIAFDVPASA